MPQYAYWYHKREHQYTFGGEPKDIPSTLLEYTKYTSNLSAAWCVFTILLPKGPTPNYSLTEQTHTYPLEHSKSNPEIHDHKANLPLKLLTAVITYSEWKPSSKHLKRSWTLNIQPVRKTYKMVRNSHQESVLELYITSYLIKSFPSSTPW